MRALALLLALCGPVSAAELTPRQARDVLAVAYGQFHGPRTLLENPPPIHIVAQEQMCQLAHIQAPCPIKGLYLDGVVYVDEALDFSTVEAASVLLHEFVHHFQMQTRGPVRDCADALEREQQAYRIQSLVLMKAGKDMAARAVQLAARAQRC